ncbi:MAG: hypothetical protein ACYDHP_10510 [Ferrimicrobium sp.]
MDDILASQPRDLGRVLDYLSATLGCRITISPGRDWEMRAHATWICPDWRWFRRDVAKTFSQVEGFSVLRKSDNIGRKHDSFVAVGENPVNVALKLIVEVEAFYRQCLDDCEAWLLAHVDEIEICASVAFEQGRLSIDAFNGLHEWINALVPLRI